MSVPYIEPRVLALIFDRPAPIERQPHVNYILILVAVGLLLLGLPAIFKGLCARDEAFGRRQFKAGRPLNLGWSKWAQKGWVLAWGEASRRGRK